MTTYLTIPETCDRFRIRRAFLFMLLRQGAPSLKIGRRRVIPQEPFEQWAKRCFGEGEWDELVPARRRLSGARRPRKGAVTRVPVK